MCMEASDFRVSFVLVFVDVLENLSTMSKLVVFIKLY